MAHEMYQGVSYTGTLPQTILDVYSKEVEFHAQPVLRFAQFAVTKTDLQAQPGLTVKVTVYDNLAMGGQLDELQPIGIQQLSASQKEITVTEWGNAIAVTELLLQASFDDVMSSAAKLLGMDYARVLDKALMDTVLSGTQVIYGGGKGSRAEITAEDKFDSDVIKDAVEVLATNNAGKYNNEYYVCFVHPHHTRGLRDNPEFHEVTEYGKQYAGEIGRIHDVIFIETTVLPVLKGAGEDGTDVYQAVMFGENAYALAVALPVEMRDGGIEDFGRIHKLAWYSIFGTGILQDANIVRIETA